MSAGKILHVIGGLGPGGAETLLFRLITRPSAVRHEVICLGGHDWYSEPLRDHGIAVAHLGMTSLRAGLTGVFKLDRLVRSSGADVIQGWMYRSNLLAGLAGRRAGIPVVWGIHNSTLDSLGPMARLWVYASGALAGRVPSYVINCSKESARLHHALGFDRAPSEVIANGYDAAQFAPDPALRRATRAALGVGVDDFLIGTVARWHPQKDIPVLLDAFAIARNAGLRGRLVLVGHLLDPANRALNSAVAAAGLGEVCQLLGRRRDVPAIGGALDLHVLSSCSGEAFPNAVAETMLCGAPNLVTDVGDAALMVGDTGWVVPPRDAKALADRMVEAARLFAGDPVKSQARRAAARNRIATEFTLARMAAAYEAVWCSVAKELE